MHFCLAFNYLQTGGIQTLMVRMARWLVGAGHTVTVIAREDGPMRSAFPAEVTVIVEHTLYERMLHGRDESAAKELLSRHVKHGLIDVFYCFCHDSLWVAAGLLNAQGRPARCLAGVYTLGDYLIGPRVRGSRVVSSLTYPSRYLFQYCLPPESRVFVNSAMQEYVQSHSRVEMTGRIWPLPVDGTPYLNLARKPERGLIVSIGRLAPMKEYNLWMVNVLRDLVKEGLDVRWEVYGDGPLRPEMERRIREAGIEARVRLVGEVPYAQLPAIFARAWVFVGMGTTLVEAGFAAVPAVAATAFETRGLSHGYLHDLPEYSCGEPVSRPQTPAGQLIRKVLALGPAGYAQHGAAERAHAQRFGLDHLMPRFLELVEQSPSFSRLWRPSWSIVSSRSYLAGAGWWRRIVRGYGRDPVQAREARLKHGALA